MQQIQIIGVRDLDEMEIESINRIANRHYQKIQRELKNDISIKLHIKSHKKEGKQKKYSMHVKVITPTRTFASTKAFDWKLENALHKSFTDVMKIIQHSLHTDNQHKKTY
ncbi:hypothetical protein HYX01_00255 [Candidatus Woesearchaeota archaeon]|nr:hypothetical protein [Candidatus Woesearchaeota archaeon]